MKKKKEKTEYAERRKKAFPVKIAILSAFFFFFFPKLQTDKIHMAVLVWYLVNSDASVRQCTATYTGQVTFQRVAETHGHV